MNDTALSGPSLVYQYDARPMCDEGRNNKKKESTWAIAIQTGITNLPYRPIVR